MVDRVKLLGSVNGDRELLVKLLRTFADQSDAMLSAVGDAVMTKNAYALERSAHALRGTVSILRAVPAAQAALKLEMMGKTAELGGVETAYQTLHAELGRVAIDLRDLEKELCNPES